MTGPPGNPFDTSHLPPLRMTLAQWHNVRRRVRSSEGGGTDKWDKKPAFTGPLTQFKYGTRTRSTWRGRFQWWYIGTLETGVFFVGVDDEREYDTTELARHVSRQHAVSTRGPDRYHAIIDARCVPPQLWPVPAKIRGANGLHAADILVNNHIPVPGSEHWSGVLYEPVPHSYGVLPSVVATPQILEAIVADQHAPYAEGHAGGPGGYGGGHDGEVAAPVLGWVRQAVNAGRDPADPAVKEEIYQRWLEVAIPQDPSYPFDREDFEKRHYRTAAAKAAAEDAQERQEWERWGPGLVRWCKRANARGERDATSGRGRKAER